MRSTRSISAQHGDRPQAGQGVAGTRMRAISEAEVSSRIAADIEGVRVGPFAFVAVERRASPQLIADRIERQSFPETNMMLPRRIALHPA
jgi:hypothetical protein